MIRFCLLVLLAACADHAAQPSISCGSATCGGAQFCAQVCTCCGIDAGVPSGYDECRATPAPCADLDGEALRECLGSQTGGEALDSTAPRVVAFPCE
ncbi:MAG TPA: hypothetical protein VGF94_04580 [Kofleriaceae bacterium]|jgi:hypothetical protein